MKRLAFVGDVGIYMSWADDTRRPLRESLGNMGETRMKHTSRYRGNSKEILGAVCLIK